MKAATKDQIMQIKDTAISIHAAREGGDKHFENGALKYGISIHAAREGGDRRFAVNMA